MQRGVGEDQSINNLISADYSGSGTVTLGSSKVSDAKSRRAPCDRRSRTTIGYAFGNKTSALVAVPAFRNYEQ